MKLKNVVPKMDEMFGALEFAGRKEEITAYVGGRRKVVGKQYHLYSEKQPADDIVVTLPANVGDKGFDYESRVMLVNPVLVASGKKVGDSGYADYELCADDMQKDVAVQTENK